MVICGNVFILFAFILHAKKLDKKHVQLNIKIHRSEIGAARGYFVRHIV